MLSLTINYIAFSEHVDSRVSAANKLVGLIRPGVGKLFCLVDRFKSENVSRTGIKNKDKYSANEFYEVSILLKISVTKV